MIAARCEAAQPAVRPQQCPSNAPARQPRPVPSPPHLHAAHGGARGPPYETIPSLLLFPTAELLLYLLPVRMAGCERLQRLAVPVNVAKVLTLLSDRIGHGMVSIPIPAHPAAGRLLPREQARMRCVPGWQWDRKKLPEATCSHLQHASRKVEQQTCSDGCGSAEMPLVRRPACPPSG